MNDMQQLNLGDMDPESALMQITEQIDQAIYSLMAIKNMGYEIPIKDLVTALANALKYTYYAIKDGLSSLTIPDPSLITRSFRNYLLAVDELGELKNDFNESHLLGHLDDAICSLRSALIAYEDSNIMEAIIQLRPCSRSIIDASYIFNE